MHNIQIPSAAPSFIRIWAIRSPLKIHWYTCMSFETSWSRLIYTKLSSHRSFVINMYVVKMAWRCVFLWSFHPSPQRRREMKIFGYISRFPRILNKNNHKKEENLNWTLVNTENLRAEIAACQRQYYMYNPVVTIAICTTRAKIITKWRFWTTHYPCSTENGTGISSQSISKI